MTHIDTLSGNDTLLTTYVTMMTSTDKMGKMMTRIDSSGDNDDTYVSLGDNDDTY